MIELDHLVLPVADLDDAATSLTEAGFVVTPTAAHPFGTANRLVVFEHCYLELVTVVEPASIPATGFARAVADHLDAGRAGFSHFACSAASVNEAGDAVRAAGFEAGDPMWFSRPAPRSDGSQVTASFTLLPIAGQPQQFFCVHHMPEAVWFRPHLRHPNGVRRVEQIASTITPALPIRAVEGGGDRLGFDVTVEPLDVSGVRFG